MHLSSPAFEDGDWIPLRHTGQGADLSPPLEWSGAPAGTASFALVCDDPDAAGGVWVHWVLWGIPPHYVRLPEGVPPSDRFTDGLRQGLNDFQHLGYGGPLPPAGPPHRYHFTLLALNCELQLGSRSRQPDMLAAARGAILAQARLLGRYQRRSNL